MALISPATNLLRHQDAPRWQLTNGGGPVPGAAESKAFSDDSLRAMLPIEKDDQNDRGHQGDKHPH